MSQLAQLQFTDPCSQQVRQRMIKNMTCDCHPACMEVIYDTSVSTSRWPSPQYATLMAVQAIVPDEEAM